MRGKACFMLLKDCIAGITPAYAGKSPCWRLNHLRCRDHPRLCGEKSYPKVSSNSIAGSPPPMRGKVKTTPPHRNEPRITPAYAGKSSSLRRLGCPWWDHPRLCGEKYSRWRFASISPGSPPPMRGKDFAIIKTKNVIRITPAYAGKRSVPVRKFHGSWDHPRLCGEKTKKILKQRYFFHQPASFSFSLQYT